MKVQVAREIKVEGRLDSYEDNPDLRYIIEWILGEGVESYVERLISGVCKAIAKDSHLIDDFQIRIIGGDNPKAAWAFKHTQDIRRDSQNFFYPDMVITFANDLVEFTKCIIHEALHCLNYEEDVVEGKTQELFALIGIPTIES